MKSIAIILATAMTLSGCTSWRGPGPIYGPTGATVSNVPALAANPGDLRSRFADAAKVAQGDSSRAATDAELRTFMNRGFTLTYANCDSYFLMMGRHQRRARVFRDSISPVTALITGLIPLINFDGEKGAENALKYLALGSAFTTAALSIYDEHFLFGAENIDSVQTLTRRALIEQMNAAQGGSGTLTFDQAVIHILDNHAVCTPQRILAMSRQAIANGNVVVPNSGDDTKVEEEDPTDPNPPPPPPPPPPPAAKGTKAKSVGAFQSFTPEIAPQR